MSSRVVSSCSLGVVLWRIEVVYDCLECFDDVCDRLAVFECVLDDDSKWFCIRRLAEDENIIVVVIKGARFVDVEESVLLCCAWVLVGFGTRLLLWK